MKIRLGFALFILILAACKVEPTDDTTESRVIYVGRVNEEFSSLSYTPGLPIAFDQATNRSIVQARIESGKKTLRLNGWIDQNECTYNHSLSDSEWVSLQTTVKLLKICRYERGNSPTICPLFFYNDFLTINSKYQDYKFSSAPIECSENTFELCDSIDIFYATELIQSIAKNNLLLCVP